MTDEQRALLASPKSVPRDVERRLARVAAKKAHINRRAHMWAAELSSLAMLQGTVWEEVLEAR
jgi:hypothetical protein